MQVLETIRRRKAELQELLGLPRDTVRLTESELEAAKTKWVAESDAPRHFPARFFLDHEYAGLCWVSVSNFDTELSVSLDDNSEIIFHKVYEKMERLLPLKEGSRTWNIGYSHKEEGGLRAAYLSRPAGSVLEADTKDNRPDYVRAAECVKAVNFFSGRRLVVEPISRERVSGLT